MNLIEQYVDTMTLKHVIQIINDYEAYERDGSTGDTNLRVASEHLSHDVFKGGVGVAMVMERVAFECYRRVAHEHIFKEGL